MAESPASNRPLPSPVAPASDRPRVSTRAAAGTDTSKSVFRRFGSLASSFAKKLVGDSGQLYRDNRLQAIKSKEMEVAAVNITLLNESADLQSQQNDLLAKIIAELKGRSLGPQDTSDLPDIDLDRRGKGRPPKPRGQRGRFGSRARERLQRIKSAQRARQMQNLRQRVTKGVQAARQVAKEAVTRLRPPTPAAPATPPAPRPPVASTPAPASPAPRPPVTPPAPVVSTPAPRPPVTPPAPVAPPTTPAPPAAPGIGSTIARGVGRALVPAATVGAGIYEAYSGVSQANQDLAAGRITAEEASQARGAAVGQGAGGAGGALAGAAIGAAAGSVVPIVGTAIGGIVGGAVGYMAGGAAGRSVGSAVTAPRATQQRTPTAPAPAAAERTTEQQSSTISPLEHARRSAPAVNVESFDLHRFRRNDPEGAEEYEKRVTERTSQLAAQEEQFQIDRDRRVDAVRLLAAGPESTARWYAALEIAQREILAEYSDRIRGADAGSVAQPPQANVVTPPIAPPVESQPGAAPVAERSPGFLSRVFGRGRSTDQPATTGPRISSGAQPRITRPPAAPALGEGAIAASPYGADVGSMGLEPQSSVAPTPPASTRTGSHVHTEGEIKDLEGIVRKALGPNRREHVDEVVEQLLTLPFPFFSGRPLPRSNFGIESIVRDYINTRPELRDPVLERAVQQMDAGGRETHRMVQEQQAGPESLVSPMSYAVTGVRQEQLPANISSILQLLSGVEFNSIKIEAKSIEFDGSVKTAAQASVDQYATRIAAPAAGPMPAAAEVTPESTPTPSAPSTPSTGSSASASQPAARPAPGGSGMLSRLGRSIFGGGGGGSSSPSAGAPSAQQTAAAPATPSIGGGGGGGGGAGASSGTITEVVERGPGFNVVKYDDGKVERRTGARNWRNNNPGNIEFGDFARRQGAIGTDGRFAIFPTYEVGKRAKEALLFEGRNYSGLTIAQAITRYAPPSENDTAMYIRVAAGAAGVAPTTPMKDLNSGQRQALLAAMERVEGFRVGNVQVIQQGTAVASAEQAPPGPGPTLAAEGTQMAAADQAQMRGEGQQVVVQVPPPSAQQRIASADQQAPSGGRGEVSLNRRLEKQVA